MEAAGIGWLAQSILSSPLIGKPPDPWVREAGLAEEIEGLTSAIKGVRVVVSAVDGRELGNEPLAESLADLKEVLYDAANVVDDLDYHRLKQGKPADILPTSSSRGKRQRSKAWDHFVVIRDGNGNPEKAKCKYCQSVVQCKTINGTGVLSRHIKSAGCREMASHQQQEPSSSIGNGTRTIGNPSRSKRMRIDHDSTQVTTDNTNPWNKEEISSRLQEIINQLQGIQGGLRGILEILGLDSAATLSKSRSTTHDPCRRTSNLVQRKIYGRAAEKKFIINLIREHKSAAGVTVVPIVGIGGVGKTALAQVVYNDPAVGNQFDLRIWIWVSNMFDEVRLTREMLNFVSREIHQGLCSFAKLQEVLKSNQLLAPFTSDGANNNLILMTTRKPSFAKRRGTTEPIKLSALGKDDFYLLFKVCAFGDENYKEEESLRDIGQQIVQKLKGNPLAAQTAGSILREHLSIEHWTRNLRNEYWKSLQLTSGIMPALKLCYDGMPFHLQQCFSYCSIFPYNYQFPAEELIHMWISQGFVKRDSSSECLEEIGKSYLTDLVNLGFFEQVEEIEQTHNISRSEKFEEKIRIAFTSVKTLRTLVWVNHTHLRYLKLEAVHVELGSPSQVKSKFSHQILDGWLTSLQIIHLENCGQGWILPCLERFPFLTRLKLSNMEEVREVSVPSLEELVLVEMPDLENCFCTSLGDMNSSLRVLEIRGCPALKMFNLLEKHHSFKMENNAWLPSVTKFVICDCPHLQVLAPLRPSTAFSELLIRRVSTFLTMKCFSMETFEIRPNCLLGESSGVIRLDDKILAFHNLRDLKHLEIKGCKNLVSISLISLSHLVSLESLSIENCAKLFSSDILSPHTHEDVIAAEYNALPYLESLSIVSCGITGKWLSLMLRHAPAMKELVIHDCPKLTELRIEGGGNSQSNLILASEASSSGYQNDLSASSAQDGLWCVPLNITSSLKKITIRECPSLTFDGSREGFVGFTSLEYLQIWECPELFSSLVHERLLLPQSLSEIALFMYSQETLQPCFPNNHTCLKDLEVRHSQRLKSLTLHSCKSLAALHGMESLGTLRSLALYENSTLEFLQLESFTLLEDLRIYYCTSLLTLEGLRSTMNLRCLRVVRSPIEALTSAGESYELIDGIFPRLESLTIDDSSRLMTSFYKGLTCLQQLELYSLEEERLTDEQERAFLLHRSLQNLQFMHCDDLLNLPAGLHGLPSLKTLMIYNCNHISRPPKEGLPLSLEKLLLCYCDDLVDLPAGLHSLPSLKTLKIECCHRISQLPKEGLPPSLEELEINYCSKKLSKQCRSLATSKLKVKITG
ncbi:putative disease resistance protein RGA4 [Triticum aestivum]|uniref:putative disease resistance protein RGA4 n=1 Tax=Triticum aestivum TaxID=4565 RepID=UPI001D01A4AB|nr:putative disease resistance protein RGA4 [Triticum aestivum]